MPSIKSEIEIGGLAVFEGRLLTPDDPVFVSLSTIEDFTRFARQLRGQFSILSRAGEQVTAITDFGCSRPVFYLRDPKTPAWRVSPRVSELAPFSRKRLRREALFFYATRGGVGIDPFFDDIEEMLPATVMRFRDGRTEARTYLDWRDFLEPRPIDPEAAERRFVEIASGYLSAVLKGRSDVGCMLSSGNDSALMAWLLREIGIRSLCLTADYSWKRYSEFASAEATARAVGFPQERVLVTASSRGDAFFALNSARQNAPCSVGISPIFHRVADAASKHGLSLLVTGDHADSLFLGFDRFFRAFPAETQAYLQATVDLSPSAKLSHLHAKPEPRRDCAELLSAFGSTVADCLAWDEERYKDDCERLAPWLDSTPLHTLQQLSGQMWAGISWQNLFLPVTQAFEDRIEFVSPFYDLEMVRFALSLPLEYKFRNGSTKVLLRDVLTRSLGLKLAKRASPNPARIWRLRPDFRERSLQGAALRPVYDKAFRRNLAARGNSWSEVDRVAALGLWLAAHSAGPVA